MSSILSITLQAAGLAALSNILAQTISTYQGQKPLAIDFTPFIQFVTWAFISTPPNILWQQYLEERFPTSTPDSHGKGKVSVVNTIKKFLLDQTISSSLNTAAFIAGMSALKGRSSDEIIAAVQHDFWPLISSGWKLWPMVSLINFTIMPADKRILFGNIVGLFWGIYLSLVTS